MGAAWSMSIPLNVMLADAPAPSVHLPVADWLAPFALRTTGALAVVTLAGLHVKVTVTL